MDERPRGWRARAAPYLKLGWRDGASALAKRGLQDWLTWGSVIVSESQILELQPDPLDPAITVREIRRDDLTRLAEAFDSSADELAERLESSDEHGIAAFDGTRPLSMRWSSTRPQLVPETAQWIHTPFPAIYHYHAVTHRKARGNRLVTTVGRIGDTMLFRAGFRTRVTYVRGDNRPMWQAMGRAAVPWRALFRIYYLARPGREPIVMGRFGPPVFSQRPA